VIGIGIIVGNLFAGEIGTRATDIETGTLDYAYLFAVPLAITVISLLMLLALYPGGRKSA
jgi:hypothetical protein